jgi:hypothetical protein
MGLKAREKNLSYVRIKNGMFYLSEDKEFSTPYAELEGLIVGMYFRNEVFNGKPLEKLYVIMQDGPERYAVSFPFDSSYTTSFLSFIKNADLSRPVSLNLKQDAIKDSDTKRTKFLISQGGEFLKSFYTKDNPNGMPPMVQKRNGKWDKDDMMDFIRDTFEKEIIPTVEGNRPIISNIEHSPTEPTAKLPWENETVDTVEYEDLPF